ncbi:MAG: hypothetical protein HQK96_10765 [Nitrospirae bacterium]|nr:hypothetical protein [Nitrospirota bacterium]
MFSLTDIETRTGFSRAYINKCLKELRDVLNPFIKRGNNNAILLNSDGLVIFDKIRQMKDQGMALPEVKIELAKIPQTPDKPYSKGTTNPGKTPPQTELLQEILKLAQVNQEHNRQLVKDIEERDQIIKELSVKNERLEGSLKLLTDGRNPEQVRADWEKARQKEVELEQNLRMLTNGREPAVVKKESENRAKRRAEILRRLGEIDGHLFKGKERKRLLEELQNLE